MTDIASDMQDSSIDTSAAAKGSAGLIKSTTKRLWEGWPETDYTVVDATPDESSERLRELHAGDDIACALIDAAVQLRRNSGHKDPKAWEAFVRRLAGGVKDPVLYVTLVGVDGVERNLVLSGNMRVLGSREINITNATKGEARLKVRGIPQKFSGTAEEVYRKALNLKSYGNVRWCMSETAKAELACQLNESGKGTEDIAVECEVPEGRVKDLVVIGELMADRKLSEKALAAIDEGRFGVQVARNMARMSHAEQDAKLTKGAGGGNGAGGAGEDAKRPKAPPALFIIDAHKAAKRCGVGDEAIACLEFLRADTPEKRIAIVKKWPALGKAFADGGFDIGTGRIKK
jgi:hypothetical protein